ncbi:MAG TPA: RNA polymerase sigma factor [Solirubrobacteraceae bacterium]
MAYAADTDGMTPALVRPRFGRPRLVGEDAESELLARVRSGDDAAFEALYDAYHRRLLAFCQHMLGSREEAEDVLQHTFLAAYRSLRAGYEVVDLKPWLYTIARNRCLSVLRVRRDEVELDDTLATEGLGTEVDQRADLRMLVRDVQRLPPDQRAALVLFEVGDHSHKEIAAVLGVRREKVKALVFQAREALMGWRTARDTPCAHIREQVATLRGRALGRATIRRHVELCSGCADYEAAVRRQRAALAIALPVAPAAAGLKSAVVGSAAGGSGLGAAAGAGGASSAAGGLAGLGINCVAAKVLLVTVLAGGAGVARQATADRPHGRPALTATPRPQVAPAVSPARLIMATRAAAQPAVAVRRAAASAPAARAASKVAAKAHHAPARAGGHGRGAAAGKAAAPGHLKAPGAPAQGKALGATKGRGPKPAGVKVKPGNASAAPKPPRTKAVSSPPAKPPKAPAAAATPAPSPPGQSAEPPPGQARKQADPSNTP